jgi:hypothetical protein
MKNYWIHVYSSNDLTLKFFHRNWGKATIEAINIIPLYDGTPLFMAAGHPIYRIHTAVMDCADPICCVN